VRDDPNLGECQVGVGFDAVDQRGATRRGGKQPLQNDDTRTPRGNGLEGFGHFAIGKRQHLALAVNALPERVEVFGSADDDRARFGHESRSLL